MKKGKNLMFNLISLKDFAKGLNKPEGTIRTWKRRGDLPSSIFITIGSSLFIKENKFMEWLEKGNEMST
jgi:hypothetical protein